MQEAARETVRALAGVQLITTPCAALAAATSQPRDAIALLTVNAVASILSALVILLPEVMRRPDNARSATPTDNAPPTD